MPTFPINSQEELDRIIEERLARARQQWERESGLADTRRQRDEAVQRADQVATESLEKLIRRDARDVLSSMNVRDAKRQDFVMKLADFSTVMADDTGEPNRKAIIDALKSVHTDAPDVFGPEARVTESAPDGLSGSGDSSTSGGPLTREQVADMSPEAINSNWDRVKAFLSGERG